MVSIVFFQDLVMSSTWVEETIVGGLRTGELNAHTEPSSS